MSRRRRVQTNGPTKTTLYIRLLIAILGVPGAILGCYTAFSGPENNESCSHVIGDWQGVAIDNHWLVYHNPYLKGNPYFRTLTKTVEGKFHPDSLYRLHEQLRMPLFYQFGYELAQNPQLGFPVPLIPEAVELLQEKERKQQMGIYTHPQLSKVFRIAFDSLYYDCQSHQYRYTVGIAVPTDLDTFLQEIKSILAYHLGLVLGRTKPEELIGETYNLASLIKRLEEETGFSHAMCAELQQDSSYYALFRGLSAIKEGSRTACELQFETGEFSIHPTAIAILEYLGDRFAEYLKKHPKQETILLCRGYSSPQKVASIRYGDEGRWHKSKGPLPYPQQAGLAIPDTITRQNGNLQLSYARAFSGIQYLGQYLQSRHNITPENTRIKFRYQGLGVDHSSNGSPRESKRIEVSLILDSPRNPS